MTGCFKGSEEGGEEGCPGLEPESGKAGNLLKAIRGVDPPSGPAHWFSWKFDLAFPSETEWQALYIQVSWNKEWIFCQLGLPRQEHMGAVELSYDALT